MGQVNTLLATLDAGWVHTVSSSSSRRRPTCEAGGRGNKLQGGACGMRYNQVPYT